MNKTYRAELSLLSEIAKDIENFCNENSVSSADLYAINLVVDELFTNSVMYGYNGNTSGCVNVDLSCNKDGVKIVLSDNAPQFNPLVQVVEPDLNSNVDERKIGGLGVFFARKQMDEISYEFKNAHNVITMFRKFSK